MRASRGLVALAMAGLLAVAIASCASPPPSAYYGGSSVAAGTAVSLGTNASGEACTQQARGGTGGGVDIFCGTWTQPSGSVARDGAADAGALTALATHGPWRDGIDSRFNCGPPTATTILGGAPAVVMQCTRKVGGWPQVAMVASVDGTAYVADGIEPAISVIQRGIGVVSGRMRADAAATMGKSNADALFAGRLAAQAFSAGNIGQYEQLMTEATKQNLEDNFNSAETLYRAALALQEKALGANDPNLALPIMLLALQISDEGRFAEATPLFARADRLAARASDPSMPARLLHYEGLHALNQGKDQDALSLLRRAAAAYAVLLPPAALAPRARPGSPAQVLAASGGATRTDPLPKDDVILDPTQQTALIGIIEAERNQSIALRHLHRDPEADAAIAAAVALADAHGMRQAKLTSRLYRTAAANAAAEGNQSEAASGLSYSAAAFSDAFPGTRPVAVTRMLQAAALHRDGDDAAAFSRCASAVDLLRALKDGVPADVMEPCLEVYIATADRAAPADRQAILADMFEAAQLAQGDVTGKLIAGATARLAENARDPKVGAAVRRRQDAQAHLDDLTHQRDLLAAGAGGNGGGELMPRISADDLDKQIVAARNEVADSEAALEAASPNFAQLVQDATPASAVLSALGPDEAFAMIALGPNDGFVFVLRDGQITAARMDNGAAKMAALVKRVRDGIEPTEKGIPRFDAADDQAIYADTLGRLEPALTGVKHLVVAPAGPLLSLPFGVLLTGPADPDKLLNAPWLINRYDIAHVPAAANFVSLRKVANSSRATKPWFGFGEFVPVTLAQAEKTFPTSSCADSAKLFAGLPPLASAGPELNAARTVLGAPTNDELLGPAFTTAAVERSDLSDYKVLHFAAHALLPTDLACAAEPAIVTSAPPRAPDANGAMLKASDVLNLKLDADLVILSACNSGGPGGTDGGESLSGLARSFFYAGARSMLVTHWSVNDQTAAFLVANTANEIHKGAGVAAAMRTSQLALLNAARTSGPAALAHPFYWAPFAVIGEGRGKLVSAALPQRFAGP
jgi:CHAT domain-containing protein